MFLFKKQRLNIASVKSKLKFVRFAFPVMLLISMFGLMVAPAVNLKTAKVGATDAPRFNFLEGDHEMLRLAKTTDTTWSDPVSANIGDRVSFLVYYHNGIVNSTAHSTKIRVDLPINESNKLVAKSWLWSQETAAISDTIVNGQVVGLSGGTVNLPSTGRIEYVAGSTNWFPNRTSTPTHMPDGIMSDSGLDIGDIQGCWQYSGFVSFMADIKGPAQLVMDKTVAHPGDTTWHEEITANPGDSIAYHLGVRNEGGTSASGVLVKDILPTYMTYTPGTTYIYTKDHPEGIKQADTLFTGGIVISDIAPGQDNVVYVTYRTKIDVDMPAGAFALNNVAKVFLNGVEQDQDQAKVTVTAQRGLVLDKKVSNGVSWVEQNTANFGDTISYRIIVRNTGNTPLSNVILKDALPMFVNYVNGSTKIDGVATGDSINTANGLALGSIAAGAEKTITLQGKIVGCAPLGQSNLLNTAFGRADSVTEISDSATTILTVMAPVTPPTNN